jgi:hypothetical protein
MTLLRIIAVAVTGAWVAVVAVVVAVLHSAAIIDADIGAMAATRSCSKPCPQCHLEGAALVDSDGVALCTTCGCSYEVVAL